MANSEQALQNEMGVSSSIVSAFGVDTSIVPSGTGNGEDESPCSEYSLHFKTVLVPRRWAGPRYLRWVWVEVWPLVTLTFTCRRYPTNLYTDKLRKDLRYIQAYSSGPNFHMSQSTRPATLILKEFEKILGD